MISKQKSRIRESAIVDCKREQRWLDEHGSKYAGQWVALNANRLVAHGFDGLEVYNKAKRSGVESPFLIQVEKADELSFGGW
ncbi:MAG: DUF5678 domain-containing protein [Pyrinomonadaceae bacterium]